MLLVTFLLSITNLNAAEIFPECRALVYEKYLGQKFDATSLTYDWVTDYTSRDCAKGIAKDKEQSISQAFKLSKNIDTISESLLKNSFTAKDTSKISKIIHDCQSKVLYNHKLAMLSALGVYELSPPPGYKIVQQVSKATNKENITGLQLYVLAPINDPENKKPYILSFAGTKDARDALTDIGFGADQFEEVKSLLREGTIVFDKLKSGRDLIVTGHSLGGGLAQAAAATLVDQMAFRDVTDQKHSKERTQNNWGKIKLVTFNGFGGEKLKEYSDRHTKSDRENIGLIPKNLSYDDNLAVERKTVQFQESALNQSVHYRISYDAVSRLGVHFGELRTMDPGSISPIKAHFMTTVVDTVANKEGFEKAKSERKNSGIGNWLTEIANLGIASANKAQVDRVLYKNK